LQREREGLEIDWRGFELHPETPPGGMLLTQLFGPNVERMQARTLGFAKSVGIEDMKPNPRLPNTRRVLAMAEFARDQGKLHPFREAAMGGYWRRGKDLEDDAALREIAAKVGLDPEAAVAAGRDPKYLAKVDAAREDAHRHGVNAIPTFFINGYRIVGAQPYEVLKGALDEAS
jgi:predicted DsbA family dithiol-disulfide isomerase